MPPTTNGEIFVFVLNGNQIDKFHLETPVRGRRDQQVFFLFFGYFFPCPRKISGDFKIMGFNPHA